MKRKTLQAMAHNVKTVEEPDHEFNIVIELKKKCKKLFKSKFEARVFEEFVQPKAVRFYIDRLTLKDVLSVTNSDGVVDIDALIKLMIERATEGVN